MLIAAFISLALLTMGVPLLLNGAAYFELARVRRADPDCEETQHGSAALRTFLRECATSSYFLFDALRPLRLPPAHDHAATARRVVVLVPDRGLLARSHRWVLSGLESAGETVVPCVVPKGAGLAAAAESLDACLAALPPVPEEIVLLGIGTGGLVARYHLRRRNAPRVRRLFTIGCPHFGTVSNVARRLGWSMAGVDEPPIRQLSALDRVPDQFAVTSIAADFDAWILPLRNRDYPGAFNIQVRGYGHLGLLASRRTVELLMENLNA